MLRRQPVELDLARRLDLVRGQLRVRGQLVRIEAAGDLGAVDGAVVVVRRPEPAEHERGGADRATIVVRDLLRIRRVGEVDHREAALVPGLRHDVAAGHRDDRRQVRDAVLLQRLGDRQLVVAAEDELAVDDVVDRVRAPAEVVGGPAARRGAAAPLVGEDDRLAVVRERRPVPVGVVGVGDGVDPDRVGRVADVEQQAVPLAGAGGEPDLRVGRDVVARVARRARRIGGAGRMQWLGRPVLEDR